MRYLALAAACSLYLPAEASAGWLKTIATSPIDDSRRVVLALDANIPIAVRGGRLVLPSLHLRCSENRTVAFVHFDAFLGTSTVDVITRLDAETAQQSTWGVSSDHEAAGLWNTPTAVPFIRSLLGRERLFVRTTPPGEPPKEIFFGLDGLGDLVGDLASACDWSVYPGTPLETYVYGQIYGEETDAGRLVLVATGNSWVQVRGLDDQILFTRVLKPSEGYHVPNSPGLTMLTGDAGGLGVFLDGELILPTLGAPGSVRRDIPLDPVLLPGFLN